MIHNAILPNSVMLHRNCSETKLLNYCEIRNVVKYGRLFTLGFFFSQSFVVIHYICVVKFAGLLAYINNNIVVIFGMVVVLSRFELLQNLLDSDIVCLWGDGYAVELQSEVLVTVLSNWHGYVPLYLWSLR